MFGYGKDKKYVSFPHDWIKPGELLYDSGGEKIIKGNMQELTELAAHRRDVQKLEPVFWMKKHGGSN